MKKEPVAKEIMRKKFTSLKKADSLDKAIRIFLKEPDMVFPVVDEKGKLVGEIEQHAILKLALPSKYIYEETILGPQGIRQAMDRYATKVEDLMKTHEVKVPEDTKLSEIAKLMLDSDIRTLEVVNRKLNPIGFVSELDIIKYVDKTILAGKRTQR